MEHRSRLKSAVLGIVMLVKKCYTVNIFKIGDWFMAINMAMRAALKALSYTDVDIKKTYMAERRIQDLSSRLSKNSKGYRFWDRKVLCEGRRIPVRIFTPGGNLSGAVLLFFHGGGWVTGTIDSYNHLCWNLALLTGRTVVSVEYRLAPEHPFPAGVEDCYAVARELYLNGLTKHTGEITMIGDSAGGNIAAAVSLMARDRGEFFPKRQILIYPATYYDHTEASPFPSIVENGTDYLLTSKRMCDFMDLYLAGTENRAQPYVAPLTAEDLTKQPDTLIITAEYCPLRDEGEAYGEKLRSAGNRVEIHRMADALHGYFKLPIRFTLVKRTFGIINRFLSEG